MEIKVTYPTGKRKNHFWNICHHEKDNKNPRVIHWPLFVASALKGSFKFSLGQIVTGSIIYFNPDEKYPW